MGSARPGPGATDGAVERRGAFGLILLLAIASAPARLASAGVAEGDVAWRARAEGHDGRGRARPEPIRRAILAYERARQDEPDDLEVHWKLIRALHLAGEFATREEEQQGVFLGRATQAAERAFEALARRLADAELLASDAAEALGERFAAADRSQIARIHFWTAIAWGSRATVRGLLSAVRDGVANRMHRYARVVIAIEPEVERGGAHRLLDRLHASLPRVPFLSGWVKRGR